MRVKRSKQNPRVTARILTQNFGLNFQQLD